VLRTRFRTRDPITLNKLFQTLNLNSVLISS
jgi:hypothetical protein